MLASGGSMRRRLSPGRVVCPHHALGVVTVTIALSLASAGRTEPRSAIDLEPVTLHFTLDGDSRAQVSVLSYVYGNLFSRSGFWPYFGGGLGFFTLQARAGVGWLPGNPEEPGPVIRLEARPQVRFGKCWEPMVIGSLGAGYRWPLEHGDPGYPGTAIYVLPQFVGGEGFLHPECGYGPAPIRAEPMIGGTLSGGFDF